jgi:hypothetical protein
MSRKLYLLLLFFAPAMPGAIIAVANPSFETLPAGGLTQACGAGCTFSQNGGIPDWTSAANTGQLDPSNAQLNLPVPDGTVVAYSTGGIIFQTLATNVAANTTYTLQVDIGQRKDVNISPYSINIRANLVVLATGNQVNPGAGNFLTSTATFTTGANDPSIGQALEIYLSGGGGGEVDFDNVRLTASDAAVVPEPATWAMLALGVSVLGLSRKRGNRLTCTAFRSSR